MYHEVTVTDQLIKGEARHSTIQLQMYHEVTVTDQLIKG